MESDPLAPLADATPELRALAASVGLEPWIGAATLAVARRLCGAPVGDPGPLGALWFAVADGELRLLEIACQGAPLRAAACAIAWSAHVLRHHGARAPKAVGSQRDVTVKAGGAGDEESEAHALREQLAELMGRRLPDGFPLPVSCPLPGERSALGLGALVWEQLGAGDATAAAAAAARACDEAVLALGALVPGAGWDFATGQLHRTLLARIGRLSALLGRLAVLRRVVEELGRLEALQRQARRAERGGREAVAGVRVGGELSDALGCELALLGSLETEDLFFQRLVEHRLVCLELLGTTTETAPMAAWRGPAIACVDTSGSMRGAPEAVAKALILAVVRQLVPKGRAVQLLLFGGPGEAEPLEIRRGRQGLAHLLDFLSMGFHAGTDYDTPLLRALELLKTTAYAGADVLVVTDGLCRASARVAQQVALAKQGAGARVLSVVVGGDPAGVECFSDQVWLVDPSAPIDGGVDLREWCDV
ncbi:VWA domain-containing protein [Sorangium sp. So ce315]|uniref:VWA domain-containing protein n=1 Tax=Sorangium sp. So ce315 TaxID=3133299 RepID=UPI003F60DE33